MKESDQYDRNIKKMFLKCLGTVMATGKNS